MNFTTSSQTGQLLVSHNMKHLPALILGLLKHESLRQFTQVLLDTRAHKLSILYTYSTELIINMIYPRLYSLHDIQDTVRNDIFYFFYSHDTMKAN